METVEVCRNSHIITLPPDLYCRLEKWADLHYQTLDEAGTDMIQCFLQHNDFFNVKHRRLDHYIAGNKAKIIRVLAVAGINVGQLARKLSLSPASCLYLLEQLKDDGIVVEKFWGKRVRFWVLNKESPLAERILKTLNVWFEP